MKISIKPKQKMIFDDPPPPPAKVKAPPADPEILKKALKIINDRSNQLVQDRNLLETLLSAYPGREEAYRHVHCALISLHNAGVSLSQFIKFIQ